MAIEGPVRTKDPAVEVGDPVALGMQTDGQSDHQKYMGRWIVEPRDREIIPCSLQGGQDHLEVELAIRGHDETRGCSPSAITDRQDWTRLVSKGN
jgi:hypothetical protein